ncbi:MAG: peptidase S41 [Candidatus Aminicenantes bacterium]|nr:peptidase S41 [Candidatus Aminicenantes bacterium]
MIPGFRLGSGKRSATLTLLVLLAWGSFFLRAEGRAFGDPQTADPAVMSAERWARDLDVLAAELPRRHLNLFFKTPEAEFRKGVDVLKAALPNLHPDEIMTGLLRLVASISDAHTTVGYRPRQGLPLMLYWFKDGIYVLNTTGEYEDILQGRITALGGRPIEDVAAALASVIPHENQAQLKNQAPNFLVDTAILHGLGLIPSPESVSLTVRTDAGQTATVEMRPVPFTTKPAWLVDTSNESGAPLYLRKRGVFYWHEVLPDANAVYFKYNSCQEIPGAPFAAFVKDLFAAADAGNAERIVIDLRHNGGGNSAIFAPFLDELKNRPAWLRKDGLSVLIGRRTFSSAILNALDLRKTAPVVFVGEPTGGKPNHYGEVKWFRLPESGLAVTYSTKYFQVVEGDPDAIVPDLLIEPSFADYRSKRDPVLEAALGRTP